MLRTTAFIASILLVQPAHAQHLLWDGLPSGPHNVGYRLIRVIIYGAE